jgi:hypothetical protein
VSEAHGSRPSPIAVEGGGRRGGELTQRAAV